MPVRFWISSILINSGDSIPLDPGMILLVVGPNNAGKSALLRDIDAYLRDPNNYSGQICVGIDCEQEGSTSDLTDWPLRVGSSSSPRTAETLFAGF